MSLWLARDMGIVKCSRKPGSIVNSVKLRDQSESSARLQSPTHLQQSEMLRDDCNQQWAWALLGCRKNMCGIWVGFGWVWENAQGHPQSIYMQLILPGMYVYPYSKEESQYWMEERWSLLCCCCCDCLSAWITHAMFVCGLHPCVIGVTETGQWA